MSNVFMRNDSETRLLVHILYSVHYQTFNEILNQMILHLLYNIYKYNKDNSLKISINLIQIY